MKYKSAGTRTNLKQLYHQVLKLQSHQQKTRKLEIEQFPRKAELAIAAAFWASRMQLHTLVK